VIPDPLSRPLVNPGVGGINGGGGLVEDPSVEFFPAPERQAEAVVEEDRIVVVEPVGREAILGDVDVGEARELGLEQLPVVEIAGADEVIFQPRGQEDRTRIAADVRPDATLLVALILPGPRRLVALRRERDLIEVPDGLSPCAASVT